MIETFLDLARAGGQDALPVPVAKQYSAEMSAIPGTLPILPKPKPFLEAGVTGLLRTKGVGYVYEEWLAALSTARGKQIYREMRDNDAVIGAMFFAVEMILRKAEWRVEPGQGKQAQQYAEFVEQCMEDMSHTWEDFIAECVSMFAFGFSLFETVYKRRKGPDGRKASKYDDGLIGWRKFAPRAQESILYWIWDDEGGLQGAVQLAAPDYHTVPLPIQQLLLFRTTSIKNNPEGRSVLRNCYRSWFLKKRIEEVEAIGIERDLCGLPVLYLTQEAMDSIGGEAAAKRIVTSIRRDDQMGIVLPGSFDDKGNPMVKLELLRGAGQRQADPGETIRRYNSDILNTMLAGFIELGQGDVGSFALASSKTRIFSIAMGASMDSVASVMNRIAIPRLLAMNQMDLRQAPKLKPGDIEVRDLDELSNFVMRLAQSGLTFFDKPTENYLRKQAKLPEAPEDDEAGPPLPPPGRSAAIPLRPAPPQPAAGNSADTSERLEGVA